MIERGPALLDVTYDIAWLYTATLYHNGKSDWRWLTFADDWHQFQTPLWAECHKRNDFEIRHIYPVRTTDD